MLNADWEAVEQALSLNKGIADIFKRAFNLKMTNVTSSKDKRSNLKKINKLGLLKTALSKLYK